MMTGRMQREDVGSSAEMEEEFAVGVSEGVRTFWAHLGSSDTAVGVGLLIPASVWVAVASRRQDSWGSA